MSRAAQTFKQGDITKAVKAAMKAGLPVQRVEVDRSGRIVVFVGEPEIGSQARQNEWDAI